MTERDSRTRSCSPRNRSRESAAPHISVEVTSGIVEEVFDGLASMISGHIGMQVLPYALDTVEVGAVWRQEVKDDATAERLESVAGAASAVDAIVVHDQVHPACASIAAREQPEQLTEEHGVLAGCAGRVQLTRAHIERSGQVELLILAGRDDAALMTAEHPITADLGVEMNINLVAVEHGLLGARPGFEQADLRQNAQPPLAKPRAQDDGLWRAESRTNS